jgi:hypothetical protein
MGTSPSSSYYATMNNNFFGQNVQDPAAGLSKLGTQVRQLFSTSAQRLASVTALSVPTVTSSINQVTMVVATLNGDTIASTIPVSTTFATSVVVGNPTLLSTTTTPTMTSGPFNATTVGVSVSIFQTGESSVYQ